jgi:hypothetical protein
MDWRDELDNGDLCPNEVTKYEMNRLKVFISDLLTSQRQDLLKELREEVEQMCLIILEHDKVGTVVEHDPTLSFPRGYNRCIQNVIKLLKEKELTL